MKEYDFINSNIGKKVYLTSEGDLAMGMEYRQFIYNNKERYLTLIKLTKGGMAYLLGDNGKYYSVPPRNVRLFDENINR